jgi:hypothetical protein
LSAIFRADFRLASPPEAQQAIIDAYMIYPARPLSAAASAGRAPTSLMRMTELFFRWSL